MTPRPATVETAVDDRIRRLSTASARRVIEPDTEVEGHLGDGQVVADELLTVAGLGLDLDAEQRRVLSREEVGSITRAGIHFEAVLEAGFAAEIALRREPEDPRVTFLLHEIGEETRHQRLFLRVLEDLRPTAVDPFAGTPLRRLENVVVHAVIEMPALLYTLVLAGEEIPDLIQKRAAEHPDTDPFLRRVNQYHRQEEARHLSYARAVLPEVWADAGRASRVAVRRAAPLIIGQMFDFLVHPNVYGVVGLPAWATWRQVRVDPSRVALRHEATRPVLAALVDAGAIATGEVPSGWRQLCGVDAHAQPI